MLWAFLVLALAAGTALPIQAGINAQLATWIGGPVRASTVSFAIGTAALIVVSLLVTRGLVGGGASGAPWWVWLGGGVGAFYVASTVAAAPQLGAAQLFAAVVAGQTVCSVVVDHYGLIGYKEHPLNAGRIAGVVLLAGGVALVRIF